MIDPYFEGMTISFEDFSKDVDRWIREAQETDVRILLDEIGDAILVADERYEAVVGSDRTEFEWDQLDRLPPWRSDLPINRQMLEHFSADGQWRLDGDKAQSVVIFGTHWHREFLDDYDAATAPEDDLSNIAVLDDYRSRAPGM